MHHTSLYQKLPRENDSAFREKGWGAVSAEEVVGVVDSVVECLHSSPDHFDVPGESARAD